MKRIYEGALGYISITFTLMIAFGFISYTLFLNDQYFWSSLPALLAAISLRLCLERVNRMGD